MEKTLYDCLMSKDIQSIYVKTLGPNISSKTVGNVYVSLQDVDYEFLFENIQANGTTATGTPIEKLVVEVHTKFIPEKMAIGIMIRFSDQIGQYYDCVQPLTNVEPEDIVKIIQGYARISLAAARECETYLSAYDF